MKILVEKTKEPKKNRHPKGCRLEQYSRSYDYATIHPKKDGIMRDYPIPGTADSSSNMTIHYGQSIFEGLKHIKRRIKG